MAEPPSAALTAASAVNGGATATCACVFTFSLSSLTSCNASALVLCIFQFPPMNLRLALSPPLFRSNAEHAEHAEILVVDHLALPGGGATIGRNASRPNQKKPREDVSTSACSACSAFDRKNHSSRTLIPGRSRPSRNSREAPPPVETDR